jgi:hypothetical protein
MNIQNPNQHTVHDDIMAVLKKVTRKVARMDMVFEVLSAEQVAVYINGEKVGGVRHRYVGQKYQLSVSSPNIHKERTRYGQRNDEALTEMPNRAAAIAIESWVPRTYEHIKRQVLNDSNGAYTQAKYKEESRIDAVYNKIVRSRKLANAPAYHTEAYAMHDLFRDLLINSSSVDYVKNYFSNHCNVADYLEDIARVEKARAICERVRNEGVILRFKPRTDTIEVYDITNWDTLLMPTELRSVELLPPQMMQCYAMLNIAEEGVPLWGMGLRVNEHVYYLEEAAARGGV